MAAPGSQGSLGSPFQVTPFLTFLPVLHKRSEMHLASLLVVICLHTPPQAGPLSHLRQALKAGSESYEWEILGFYMFGARLWGGAGVLGSPHGDISLALPTFHTLPRSIVRKGRGCPRASASSKFKHANHYHLNKIETYRNYASCSWKLPFSARLPARFVGLRDLLKIWV